MNVEMYFDSALAKARRILRTAGFPMFKKHGRYQPFCNTQTYDYGISVTRVGVSDSIALHATTSRLHDAATRRADRELEQRAISVLREAGMPFDDRGWLDCKRSYR